MHRHVFARNSLVSFRASQVANAPTGVEGRAHSAGPGTPSKALPGGVCVKTISVFENVAAQHCPGFTSPPGSAGVSPVHVPLEGEDAWATAPRPPAASMSEGGSRKAPCVVTHVSVFDTPAPCVATKIGRQRDSSPFSPHHLSSPTSPSKSQPQYSPVGVSTHTAAAWL